MWRGRQNAKKKETEKPAEPELSKEADTDIRVNLPQPEKEATSPMETSQAEEVKTSGSDEKLVKHMPPKAYQRLQELLDPESVLGRDYRQLASRLGFSNEYICWLQSTDGPVLRLIRACGDKKIRELKSVLKDMERIDVLQDLEQFIEETPTPREIEERQKTIEKNDVFQTRRESYDAFVCFAKNAEEDKVFVEELVQKMEGSPFNLHLCRSDRDFLGGGCYLEIAATAIEKRCKKFVVILSTNFEDSEGAMFESQVAMNLTPGAQHRRIIPILVEENYRFKIPRTMAHLTYLDFPRAEGNSFWERLAESLGWVKPL